MQELYFRAQLPGLGSLISQAPTGRALSTLTALENSPIALITLPNYYLKFDTQPNVSPNWAAAPSLHP
jgi:hypothetical protein